MEIGLFFPSAKDSVSTNRKSQSAKGDSGFDDFLSKVQESGKSETKEKPKNNISKDKKKVSADNGKKTNDNTGRTDNNKEKVNSAETAENTEVKSAEETKEPVITETQQEELVNKLAEALGITPDEIMQILNQLNIQITDLAQPEIMGNFVQALYGVDSKIDLLNIPQVNEVFAAIEDTVSDFLNSVEADASKVITQQSVIVTANVSQNVNSQNTAVQNQNPAEQIITDGEPESSEPAERQITSINHESQSADTDAGGQSAGGQKEFSSESGEQIIDLDDILNEASHAAHADTQRSAVESTVSVKTEAPVSNREVMDQITDSMKTEVRVGESEIRMTLKPESLGEVSLKIVTQNGIVTAQFIAENQRVKEIIESNFNELKESLAEAGVSISELSVSVGNNNDSESMQAYEREKSKSSRRIAKIMADSGMEVEEDINEYIHEDDVIASNVNYTA